MKYHAEIHYDSGFVYKGVVSTHDDKYYAQQIATCHGRSEAEKQGKQADKVVSAKVELMP